jgi:hypothetical protein
MLNPTQLGLPSLHNPRRRKRQSSRRRVDKRTNKAVSVLAAMKAGASLYLTYTAQGPIWSLSAGRPITNDVAELVTSSSSVVDCGGSLFDGLPGQVWKWWKGA